MNTIVEKLLLIAKLAKEIEEEADLNICIHTPKNGVHLLVDEKPEFLDNHPVVTQPRNDESCPYRSSVYIHSTELFWIHD